LQSAITGAVIQPTVWGNAVDFTITEWSAFAPGLTDRQAWLDWARNPVLPQGDDSPALAEMPPMQRRRVEKLGRMALQVAYWCQSAEAAGMPLVFASRHGDLGRTYSMLQDLARGEALSPTSFGLSTHNAIAAQYSIARKLSDNYLAVSAGAASAEAAVVEALGLLADGAAEVLVVMYDGLVPEPYAQFVDEPVCDYAWAWRLALPGPNDARFSLTMAPELATAATTPASLPHGLEALHFLLSDQPGMDFSDPPRFWQWRRRV